MDKVIKMDIAEVAMKMDGVTDKMTIKALSKMYDAASSYRWASEEIVTLAQRVQDSAAAILENRNTLLASVANEATKLEKAVEKRDDARRLFTTLADLLGYTVEE